MKRYIITEESVKAAKEEYALQFGKGASNRFNYVIDALCVPEDEEEVTTQYRSAKLAQSSLNQYHIKIIDETTSHRDITVPKPKPFGPGTRLRAANVNGVEFEIIANNTFCAINKKTGLPFMRGLDVWFTLEDLEQALIESGTTVIE